MKIDVGIDCSFFKEWIRAVNDGKIIDRDILNSLGQHVVRCSECREKLNEVGQKALGL